MSSLRLNDVGIAVLAAAFLGLGAAAVPGKVDYAVETLQDGETARPAARAESLYAAGDRSPRLLLALYRLRTQENGAPNAERLLADIAGLEKPDREIRRFLAATYRARGDMRAYVSELARDPDTLRDASARALVSGYLRYWSEYEHEFHFLETVAQQSDATPAELGRYGLLLAQRGQERQALSVLQRFDDKDAGRVRTGEAGDGSQAGEEEDERLATERSNQRAILFDLLLKRGNYPDAFTRARRWMELTGSLEFKAFLVNSFKNAGQQTLADSLLRIEASAAE